MKAKGLVICAALALALSAPVKADPIFDDTSGIGLGTSGTAFMNALYEGYEALSLERGTDADLFDAEHFNHKARRAARRSSTMPDAIMDRKLLDDDIPGLSAALARIRDAYDRGGRAIAPELSATVQVSYDCWIEAAEGRNPDTGWASESAARQDDIDRCRGAFEAAMSKLEALANYRLTEFQAAVLLGQLEKLAAQNARRAEQAEHLSRGLAAIAGLSLLRPDPRQTAPTFYHYVFKYDAAAFGGASRDRFVAALEAEGVPCDGLFYEPVYRSTLFDVDPAEFPQLGGRLPWRETSCPVAERAAFEESVWLHHRILLGTKADVDSVIDAVAKIRDNLDELRSAEHRLVRLKSMSRAERDRATLQGP